MPRAARVVGAGAPHHITQLVTQRGNNRQDVFLTDEDRRFYLAALGENSLRYGLRILGYCLMTNHVHLVALPEREETLARAMQRTHSRYAERYNRLRGRGGHLWQNRFISCALGRDHLVTALAYADLNPVRAGLVGRAEQYPWSSTGAHVSGWDGGAGRPRQLAPGAGRRPMGKRIAGTGAQERIPAPSPGNPLGTSAGRGRICARSRKGGGPLLDTWESGPPAAQPMPSADIGLWKL